MIGCYPCAIGRDHPWHDNGAEANLAPYRPGGINAPPTHHIEEK
jgi:hypothetical protein